MNVSENRMGQIRYTEFRILPAILAHHLVTRLLPEGRVRQHDLEPPAAIISERVTLDHGAAPVADPVR